MKYKALEILIVVVILFFIALFAGCKDKAEADDVSGTFEIIISEPNEPEAIDTNFNDPNTTLSFNDITIAWELGDTLIIGDGPNIYLKNLPLLDKDEVRDYALAISAAAVRLSLRNEHYEALMRLISPKLLQEPEDE